MNPEFNLTYFCKTTGKKVLAKRLALANEFKILDPETGVITFMNRNQLNKGYESSGDNRKASLGSHKRFEIFRKTVRTKGLNSKAYKNFLGAEI